MNDLELHGRPRSCRTVAEVTVAGPFGPILRSAFADQHVATYGTSTVIRTGPATNLDLTDLIRVMVERGLPVQCVRRLVDVPKQRTDARREPND